MAVNPAQRLRARRARRVDERRALEGLERVAAKLTAERRWREAYAPAPDFALIEARGAWEVPVGRLAVPSDQVLVMTTEDCVQHPPLRALTVFALVSATQAAPGLERVGADGVAVVHAHPLGAPGVAEEPERARRRGGAYVLCLLRPYKAWKAAGEQARTAGEILTAPRDAPAGPRSRAGESFSIDA